MLLKRSKKKTVVNRKDRGSLILLWIMIMVCLTAGFNIGARIPWTSTSQIFAYAGYAVLIPGFVLRWAAILQLKKAFTVDVSINEGQTLKTDGLYKKIRHPSYLGLLLILSGLSVAMANIWSVLAIVLPMFLTVSYRINVEERLLTQEFGDSYKTYKKHSWRLIPGIY